MSLVLVGQTLPPGFVNRPPQDLEAWKEFFTFQAKLMDDVDAVRSQGAAATQTRLSTSATQAKMPDALFAKVGPQAQAARTTYTNADSASAPRQQTNGPISQQFVRTFLEPRLITASTIESIRKNLTPQEWSQYESAFNTRQQEKATQQEGAAK